MCEPSLLLLALAVNAPVAFGDVDPGRSRMAQVALGIKDAVAREMKRRENARNFKSLILQEEDPFHGLMQFTPTGTPVHPYCVFYGGRDARKSWSIAEALVRRANMFERRILCTRMYQNSIGDSVHRLLGDMIFRLGLDHRFVITKTSITNPYTGAEFIFKGLQKPNELKSIEGIDDAWVAEGQDMTADGWDIFEPTIRKEGSQIIVDFNVTSEDAATHSRYVTKPPPGAYVRMVNFDQNPFLSARSRAKIEHMRETDPDTFRHVYLGVARKLSEALIFKHWIVEGFSDDLYLEAIRKGGRLFYGLDHGFANDPYAFIRFFVLDQVLYIEYEAFGWKTEFAGEMAPPLVEGGKERGELEQLLDSVPGARDWPIMADNSRPETISFLCGKGFNVAGAQKWDGCVEDGIAYIKGFRKVVIHPRCKNMAQEARTYQFKVDKITKQILPVVVDANNHGWDATRYGLDQYIKTGDLQTWAALAG
jgi:phage terminase large subunit